MPDTLSAYTVAEIRAEMGRQRISGLALSKKLGRSYSWTARRMTGAVPLSLDELEGIAHVLGKPVSQFVPESAA